MAADLWLPPGSTAHRHQVHEDDHERLQKGEDARCLDCGVRFIVRGQTVINLAD